MSQYKVCKECREVLPLTSYTQNFNKQYQKHYYQSYCKQCCSNKASKWGKENPDKVKVIKNKPEYKAKSAAQYKQWCKDNPDKISIRNNKYRVSRASNETFFIRPSFMRRLYSSPCLICGSTNNIQADHVIPVSKGGRNSEGNLIPLCQPCNSSKRARTLTEWKK